MASFIFGLVLFSFSLTCVKAEPADDVIFSSTSEMAGLDKLEGELLKKMEKYLGLLQKKRDAIDNFLETNYKDFNHEDHDAEEYVSHPINAYVLMKRTSVLWQQAKKDILDTSSEDLWKEIEKELTKLPKEDELVGATNGIFLLQETYSLNVSEFSRGKARLPFQGNHFLQSQSKLSTYDMDYIGKIAYNRGFYDRSYEWFKEAVSAEQNKGKNADKSNLKMFTKNLKTTIKSHDQVLDKRGSQGFDENRNTWRTRPVPFDEKLRKKKKYKKWISKNQTKELDFVPKLYSKHNETESWEHFNRLCRGVKMRKPEQEKDLKCFRIHYHDPYLKLGPFKLDVQSYQPFVTVFRDFFAEKEMEHYKDYAKPRLFMSEHSMKDSKVSQSGKVAAGTSTKRTSKQTWLHEVQQPGMIDPYSRIQREYKNFSTTPYHKREEVEIVDLIALGVADRIGRATRTYTAVEAGGEAFQVANYGIGGVYNHHPDAANLHHPSSQPLLEHKRQEEVAWGDRLATFMAYLSDVELGGATVFPNLGISIWPEKGSAAFWWNLVGVGYLYPFSIHGGCPVLVGSKWITNKWIRWMAQGMNMPCPRKGGLLPPLNNDVCFNPPHCKTRFNHEVFVNQNDYYEHLKTVSPDFK